MSAILPYIQILLSVLLIGAIIIQRSEASLGGAFGGADASGTRFTRRGTEKLLFNATIVIGILFGISALVVILIA